MSLIETKTVEEWLDERAKAEDPRRLASINAALVDHLLFVMGQLPWGDWRDDQIKVTAPDSKKGKR